MTYWLIFGLYWWFALIWVMAYERFVVHGLSMDARDHSAIYGSVVGFVLTTVLLIILLTV